MGPGDLGPPLISPDGALDRHGREMAGHPLTRVLERSASMLVLFMVASSFPLAPAIQADPGGSSRPSHASAIGLRLRPSDGGGDPEGHGYSAPSRHVCGTHLCVHWVSSTADAPPMNDADHDGTPDQVERTLSAFESAWALEVGRLGFRAPKSDASSHDHGPDGRLDVYLADVGIDDLAGYVATDDPNASDGGYEYRDYSAYVVVDDDFATWQLGSSGGEGGLRVTAAHELFHAVQYAYDSGEDPWLMEGTAGWMEDQFADDVNANRSWLRDSPLTEPWVPVDSSKGEHEYGAWIFFRYLTESLGRRGMDVSFIRRVWELAASSPGSPDLFSARAVAKALAHRDRRLSGALATFGVWNLFPAVFYQEGAAYPHAPIVRRHRLTQVHPIAGWATIRLNHLTTGATSFAPGSGSPIRASLRLALDAPPTWTGSGARVLVITRSGYLRAIPVSLDAQGDADISVPFGRLQVKRVVLVYANASTSYRCWTGGAYSCNGASRADRLAFSYLAALIR
jgi:hypothetical protein